MRFKELFDKQIITEEHVRKALRIFYEISLKLVKPKEPEQAAQQTQQPIPQQTQQQPPEQQSAEVPAGEPQIQEPEQTATVPPEGETTADDKQVIDLSNIHASVVTEEEDDVIERSGEGEISLTDSQKDNIQSFDDIIDVLSKAKKDGKPLIDEFSAEVMTLCASQGFQELRNKVDKSSKIFVEVYYGFKKDDSIGVRFSKRAGSDMLTSTMLVDNEIVSAKFSIDRVNEKIIEYRNYNAEKNK